MNKLVMLFIFLLLKLRLFNAVYQHHKYDFKFLQLETWTFWNLAKIPILSKENKELVILSGLKHAKDNEDVIHVLSRLVDLKFLYKNENSKKKYIKTLQEEEKYLTLIINDYFQSTQKYKTINRGANSIEKYKFRLATSKVDLAKALLRTEPNIALKKLNEANNIFTDLNKNKEIGFVKLLIQEIKK